MGIAIDLSSGAIYVGDSGSDSSYAPFGAIRVIQKGNDGIYVVTTLVKIFGTYVALVNQISKRN